MNLSTCFASPEIYFSLACFTYILSGVFGAVVRWFHMCHPYDEQGDYFYPARRQITFFYAALAIQLPYVFCPSDPDAWLFVRTFSIVYYPVCLAMLFHRYFQLGRMSRSWHSRLFFALPLLLLLVMFLLVLFGQGDILARHSLNGSMAWAS